MRTQAILLAIDEDHWASVSPQERATAPAASEGSL
jgi:hypothetical protein